MRACVRACVWGGGGGGGGWGGVVVRVRIFVLEVMCKTFSEVL